MQGGSILLNEVLDNLVEVSIDEVILDDVDDEEGLGALLHELNGWLVAREVLVLVVLAWLVNDGPGVCENVKSFILPDHECLGVDNGWLNNLLASEDTPGDCIDLVVLHVLELLAFSVHSLVRDGWELVQVVAQKFYYVHVNEELKVSFLENITVFWSPTIFLICGFGTINLWLRIEGEEFVLIHEREDLGQVIGLWSELSLGEWELFYFSINVVGEYFRNH